jgi:negative regulator of flagellin synthesis FlgM
MKISVEEVSRLLAMSPTDRSGNRSLNPLSSLPTDTDSANQAAASVEVSASAQEVRQITRLVNQLPDEREERVQALKAQIENGTYKVSGEDIADLIIRRILADSAAR